MSTAEEASIPGDSRDSSAVPVPKRSRQVHPIWIVGLAIAALASAGVYTAAQFPEFLARVLPPEAVGVAAGGGGGGAGQPDPDRVATKPSDGPSRHSSLVIRRDGAMGSGPLVTLGRPGKVHTLRDVTPTSEDPQGHVVSFQGLLAREVCRQAVLLAAREGMGASTRDATLGEVGPEAKEAGRTFEVVGPLEVANAAALRLDRLEGDRRTTELTRELVKLGPGTHDRIDLVGLVEGAEAATRETLPAWLAQAGLKPVANRFEAQGDLPAGVAASLERMAFVDQFGAARALHEAIRTQGESPARLGALSRAYANLGLLTEHQWDAMPKAFQARSLLYAQRLLARGPKSASSLRYRAYALALAGAQKAAMADLDAAAQASAAGEAVPEWVALIDAACRYDLKRLSEGPGSDSQLAKLLKAESLEGARYTSALYQAAWDAVQANPECFRAIDLLCGVSGVSNLHRATLIGPKVLEEVVPRKLAALPSAPAGLLDRGVGRDLALTLEAAGAPPRDRGEPSWGTAARFVRESRFLQVWQRLKFMNEMWGVPTDSYWEQVVGLVADHPFRPFLHSYVVPMNAPDSDLPAFAKSLDISEQTQTSWPMQWNLKPVLEPSEFALMSSLSYHHGDGVVHDLTSAIVAGAERVKTAHRLLEACPNSPLTMGVLASLDWDFAKDRLPEWEKLAGQHPAYLSWLSQHYETAGDSDELAKVLERWIAVSPDQTAFQKLAEIYKAKGSRRKWRETLDRYLTEGEDSGLDHAQVRVAIANDLMEHGKFAEARPYADAAAETWAEWAMTCAQQCAEGQQDWKAAEGWARNRAERYPGNCWSDWLLFCVRTGQGDRKAALEWTRKFSDLALGQGESPEMIPFAVAALIDGDRKAALALLKLAKPDSFLAMTADAAGDVATRDAALDQVAAEAGPLSRVAAGFCRMFREALKRGPEGRLDEAAVETLLKSSSKMGQANSAVILAMYLDNRGRHDEARSWWTRAAESPLVYRWYQPLAVMALKDHPAAAKPAKPGVEGKAPAP